MLLAVTCYDVSGDVLHTTVYDDGRDLVKHVTYRRTHMESTAEDDRHTTRIQKD